MRFRRSVRFVQFLFFGLTALPWSLLAGCHDSSGAQLAPGTSVPIASSRTQAPLAASGPSAGTDSAPGIALNSAIATVSAADAGAVPSNPQLGEPAASEPRAADLDPPLRDAAGKPLPQSDERPTLSSAGFQRRIALVAHAIVTGDADAAGAAFFPLLAYEQVKDVAKPERDYKFRLLANFKRDVLEYHRALGASAADAKFDGVTVAEKDAKWMAPGSEGNRVGYYRVLRSRLRFTLPTGRTRDFELTSLISWRGEWYVVHLHGFK